MTIISMITLSALVLVCASHMAAVRAQKQEPRRKNNIQVRVNRPGSR